MRPLEWSQEPCCCRLTEKFAALSRSLGKICSLLKAKLSAALAKGGALGIKRPELAALAKPSHSNCSQANISIHHSPLD